MQQFNITPELIIECRVYDTVRSWGHKARLLRFDNNNHIFVEVQEKRVRYFNRTWEAWTFASIIGDFCYSTKLTKEEKNAIKNYIKNRG